MDDPKKSLESLTQELIEQAGNHAFVDVEKQRIYSNIASRLAITVSHLPSAGDLLEKIQELVNTKGQPAADAFPPEAMKALSAATLESVAKHGGRPETDEAIKNKVKEIHLTVKAWKDVAARMTQETGTEYTAEQCRGIHRRLKRSK